MGRAEVVHGMQAEEEVVHHLGTEVVLLFYCEVSGHRGMERSKPFVLQQVVEHGDVAVARYPFRVEAEAGEVQLVNQVNGPITSTAAEDEACLVIVERFLQIVSPLAEGTAIGTAGTGGMLAEFHVQSPRLQPFPGAI